MKRPAAAAIGYAGADSLPRVLAAAQGALVARLLEMAAAHDVPVYRDADLAEVLSRLEAGSEIPEELFRAVAEVLAYCYRVNGAFANKMDAIMRIKAGPDA
ncbi:MAG TPA: EscU/YscU/HrcU family type III secretion system export apparatus switch protein [Spirochaetota bacterium]|nr:EscU/YscU/HrcU family type III secretion system export apparatus switch protein [Spirochaetota bacterium]